MFKKTIMVSILLSIFGNTSDLNNSKSLFSDLNPTQVQMVKNNSLQNSSVLRSRHVNISFNLLPQSISTKDKNNTQETIIFNLFPDVQYKVNIQNVKKSTVTPTTIWTGHISGMKYDHVSIAITDGIAVGSIRTENGKSFKIMYAGKGIHTVLEIDESKIPPENQPIVPNIPQDIKENALPPSAATDSGNVFDIMVVYTAAARSAMGGTAGMQSLINSSVATMNTTFTNSNMNHQVRLVHTAEVSYTSGENYSTSGFQTALYDLQGTNDGYMDEIHALRNTYNADMVQLLFNNDSSGGLAFLMQTPDNLFASFAFGVVHYGYSDGWAFDHEFGHNMGMAHDHANAEIGGSYSYAHGYQSPSYAWHTVMAYACPGWCPRIDHWSNPYVSYAGVATGVQGYADAKMAIQNNATIIANFRTSPNHFVQNDFNGDGIADILWRHTTGQYLIFFQNADGSRKGYKYGYIISNDWEIADTNDFNGDGIADILWRHTTGQYLIFFQNADGSRKGYKYGYIISNDWEIADTNDFNGDGIADILWRHTTGQYLIFFQNADGSRKGYKYGYIISNDWEIADTNDFNGDGIADILWRHTTGQYLIFFQNADGSRKGYKYGYIISNDWEIADTNDFNGDGIADILWRHTTGQYLIFFQNADGSRKGYKYGYIISNDWEIADTNDFNGDGIADILWRHTTGQYLIFFQNADGSRKGYKYGYIISNDWEII